MVLDGPQEEEIILSLLELLSPLLDFGYMK